MKYTKYILNSDIVNIDQMISKKPVWKQLSILISIIVAIFGLILLSSAIPFTTAIDSFRVLKMRYYEYMKKYRNYNYYEEVFSSLSLNHTDKEKNKLFLIKGRDILMNSEIQVLSNAHISFKMRFQYMLIKGSYQFVDQGLFVSKHVEKGVSGIIKTLSKIKQKITMSGVVA